MDIFKSYLRLQIRQLKRLEKADENDDRESVRRLIGELLEDAENGLKDA